MKRTGIAAALLAFVALLGVLAVLRSNADSSEEPSRGSVADAPRDARDAASSGIEATLIVTTLVPGAATAPSPLAAGPPTTEPLAAEPLAAPSRSVEVRGRVTGADGAPLRGAHVSVNGSAPAMPPDLLAATDADGRYTLAPPPGHSPVEIVAVAEGRETARASVTLLATGTRPATVDFALAELVALHGHLVWDDDGAPIAGATVVLERWVAPEARWPDFVPLASLVTDSDGAFDARLAGGRVLSARVATAGEKRGRRLTVELPASGAQPLTLRLTRPASVVVAVAGPVEELVAANGRGKPALRVVLEPVDAGRDGTRSAPLVSGEALLEALDPRTEWNVTLHAGSFSALLASAVRFKPGAQARLECRFDPLAMSADGAPDGPSTMAAFQFRFRVRDASGRVLDGAELSQRTTVLWNGNLPALVRSLATGKTDDPSMSSYDGEGSSDLSAPVALEVQLGGQTVVRSPVGDGDVVELVLPDVPDAATLRVVVRDGHGAERLPDRVELRRLADDERRTLRVDPRSGEIAAAVAPGAYEASLLGAEGGAAPQRIELAPGESRTLEFTDAPCGAVRGRLLPPPAAEAFASVQVHPAVGVMTFTPLTAAVDADGRFELTTLPAGRWDLACVVATGRGSAAPGPATVVVQRVDVTSGRCTEVTVPVDAPRGAPVRLRDADEAGLAREVWLESKDAGVHLSVPVSAARPALLRLPPGHYRTLSTHPSSYGEVIARGAFEVSADPSAPELVVDV